MHKSDRRDTLHMSLLLYNSRPLRVAAADSRSAMFVFSVVGRVGAAAAVGVYLVGQFPRKDVARAATYVHSMTRTATHAATQHDDHQCHQHLPDNQKDDDLIAEDGRSEFTGVLCSCNAK